MDFRRGDLLFSALFFGSWNRLLNFPVGRATQFPALTGLKFRSKNTFDFLNTKSVDCTRQFKYIFVFSVIVLWFIVLLPFHHHSDKLNLFAHFFPIHSNVCFAECVYRFHVFCMEDPTNRFFRHCVYGEWVAVIYQILFFFSLLTTAWTCDVWHAYGDTFASSFAFPVFHHKYASACPPTSLWSNDVAMLILVTRVDLFIASSF